MILVMVGLDGSGKTTMLYRLKLDTMLECIPSDSLSFVHVETIQNHNFELTMWDIGAHGRMHLLWSHYFQGKNSPQALIYVVNSADRERSEEGGKELKRLCYEDEIKIVFMLANIQDLSVEIILEHISEQMKLSTIQKRLEWNIEECSAQTGEGLLLKAIAWFVERFNQQ